MNKKQIGWILVIVSLAICVIVKAKIENSCDGCKTEITYGVSEID